ncbi:MAG: hypothetical protein JSS83_04625 [Cyanobacteria bacterium SZAS LIN-3]|nr:hypothetical protein [Cyanobacteria bacterium SZAS LIN-3]
MNRLIRIFAMCTFALAAFIALPAANAVPTLPVNMTAPAQTQSVVQPTAGPVTTDGEATLAEGVNTAGTVRVNNLANLAMLMNIVAYSGLAGSILLGGYMIQSVRSREQGRLKGVTLGVSIMLLGLMLPGAINWLVASARDAGLCN